MQTVWALACWELMITIHDVVQGSQEWHELHANRWTGSTALPLLQGKKLPAWNTFAGNKYTKRGKLLESIAIREFEVTVDAPDGVLTVGFVTNDLYPNAGFSPDGIFCDILLEVKCLNGIHHEELIKGNIPLRYMVQVHFGMVICGLRKAKILAFNPEYEQQLTVIDIEYDDKIANNIINKLAASRYQHV